MYGVFFFKQKTAYEMRISDWSSDVCSSDLVIAYARRFLDQAVGLREGSHADAAGYAIEDGVLAVTLGGGAKTGLADPSKLAGWRGDARSEEHTSELQSLMRISYAVFCLKKKKNEKDNKYDIATVDNKMNDSRRNIYT